MRGCGSACGGGGGRFAADGALPGDAGSIGYHPGGMIATIERGEGLADRARGAEPWREDRAADPWGMARVRSIATTGVSGGWPSAVYTHDGGGDIVTVGSNWYLDDGRRASCATGAGSGWRATSCGRTARTRGEAVHDGRERR